MNTDNLTHSDSITLLKEENTEQKQLIKELVEAVENYYAILEQEGITEISIKPEIDELLTKAKAHV